MDQQLRLAGILYIVAGALFIVGAIAAIVIMGGTDEILNITKQERENNAVPGISGLPLNGVLIIAYCVFNIALGLPLIAAGIGVMKLEPWGRMLGILVAGVSLANIPFGTALGIFGLTVLFADEVEPLFDEPVRRRATRPQTRRGGQ